MQTAQSVVLEHEYAVPMGQIEPLLGLGNSAPAYATACLNCGYIRLFSKMVIDRKIAESDLGSQVEGGE